MHKNLAVFFRVQKHSWVNGFHGLFIKMRTEARAVCWMAEWGLSVSVGNNKDYVTLNGAII